MAELGEHRLPVFGDVQAAAERLNGTAIATPLVENPLLSERCGARIFLKIETLQRTGSFKFRGAYNRLVQLSGEQRRHGVVAFSSGNHAQGIAAAAALLGIPATIVMPSDAPRVKTDATRALGAKIVPYERRTQSREQIAQGIARETGATVVPSFDDPDIIAGQGTLGLEMAAQCEALGAVPDFVLVPCSGGGLASGTALAFRGTSPNTRIIVAEPEGYDGTRLSLQRGERVAADGARATIADALMSTAPGVLTFALLQSLDARGVAVADADLMRAVAFAALQLKLIVEPGGAAGLAALLSGKFPARGKTVGIVLSGGNIDTAMLNRCLDEGAE